MVELLVASALALVVLGALLGLFASTRTANRTTTGIGALTDSGRFALDFIAQSARGAGYYSCSSAARYQTILNAGVTPLPYSFNNPLGGFEGANTGPAAAIALQTPPVVADGVGGVLYFVLYHDVIGKRVDQLYLL